MKVSVLIVDSQIMVAEFLSSFLQNEFKNFSFVKATSLKAARGELGRHSFDVIITEILGLESTGISFLNELKDLAPKSRCIVLSNEENAFWVDKALRNGAYGYVTKSSASREILRALDVVQQGRKYLSPDASQSFAEYFSSAQNSHLHGTLSPRELEVFVQLAQGKSLKTISFDLNLSAKTVSVHKFNIYKKTGINSSAMIARYCMEHGLLKNAA